MHVMFDLETWGTRPGCDVRSIGAVVYDPNSLFGEEYTRRHGVTFYVATDNPQYQLMSGGNEKPDYVLYEPKYPLHRDPATVKWWNEQSDDAQNAFADPVDLRDGLAHFSVWYSQLAVDSKYDVKLWCKGPHFDVAILEAAYNAVGLVVPWHYRAPRDMRTVVDIAGITYEEEKAMFTGTPHNALDDAISQAKVVCEAYRRIKVNGPA